MIYDDGDTIRFRNRDKILTGTVEGEPITDDDGSNDIIGYMVHCPEFQGAVVLKNIVTEDD